MKNSRLFLLPLLLSLTIGLSGCKTSNDSSEEDIPETPDGYVDTLPANNEGTILQAFNWKYSDIKDNMSGIANSGFKVVQTSPVQQPKNGGPNWYSFYQPVSFSIGTNSPLGTKQELKDLCDEAEKYGVAIIVDIVFNHMANVGDGHLEPDGTPIVSPEVERFEIKRLVDARNTKEVINSSVYYGHIEMINGLLNRIEKEIKQDCYYIITGGDASYVYQEIKKPNELNPYLCFEGIAEIIKNKG